MITPFYRVFSDNYHPEDDSTQEGWKLEYGLRCYLNGLVECFVNVSGRDIDDSEKYAGSIYHDIFSSLEQDTLDYYDLET